jgi:hypothetical protein
MGHKLDEEEWWFKRYRIVKARIAAWKSLSHLSITGRSLLLQAILYGSLRYWLFSMRMPESLHIALDKDSYNLLWAQQPEILSDEDGTTAKTRAYIHRRASFLPQKQGGGGVMHFRSHAQAYYAQWIRRYLEPGDQPWKKVADRWLATSIHGRGALLINGGVGGPSVRAREGLGDWASEAYVDGLWLGVVVIVVGGYGSPDGGLFFRCAPRSPLLPPPPPRRTEYTSAAVRRRWRQR